MNFKTKLVLFVFGALALLVFQSKAIMPLVLDVVSSDLFLKDDEANLNFDYTPDQMHGYAFDQCNNYIVNDLDSDEISASFTSEPVNTWDYPNHEYIINADIILNPANAQSFTRRYACQIKYTSNSSDPTELTNPDNWSIVGMSGLDNLEP